MKVAIFGLGYVGLTSAGCLTSEGHNVVGIDVSEKKVSEISAGRSPIEEPGLPDLIARGIKEGRLTCATTVGSQLATCDLALVCVGTPSGPDGAHNMSYIAEVSRQIATAVDADRTVPLTVVFRSTIRPGTIEELILPIFEASLGAGIGAVEIVYNPEFMREAVAIRDYFEPPKVVIGTSDGEPNPRMDELYRNVKSKTFYTRYREAEFTKFVDNSFHALKVCFANEIGRVALQQGLSAAKIHEIFISDTKLNISPYYFRPGGAFGGSCLPKDVRALQYISGDVGANTPVIDSLLRSNEAHKHFLFELVARNLSPDASVLMLGLAFKDNSDDLRESPKIDLARKLLHGGFKLSVYDPSLRPSHLVGQNLGYAFSHLPGLSQLLVSEEVVRNKPFDLVVDTNGLAKSLKLASRRVLDINTLQ